MKAVILAGGLGTRISEESHLRPKPMIEIGGFPILWHVMKIYAHAGVTDFVIALGYRGYMIKEYFANYYLHRSDATVDLATGSVQIHRHSSESWKVTLVDTGENSMTGGRLKRLKAYLGDEDFCFTYGDGVADIDVGRLVAFHRAHGRLATVTAVQPPGRYGALVMQGDAVTSFQEKPPGDSAWINGGYFVLSPRVLELIEGDSTSWEGSPMEMLAATGQLHAFQHSGFWQPMDTLREKTRLEELWATGRAPWKLW